jgi:hypothetical protein
MSGVLVRPGWPPGSYAPCSVVVVHGPGTATGPVVIGLDGSATSEQALGYAFEAVGHQILAEQLSGRQDKYPRAPVEPRVIHRSAYYARTLVSRPAHRRSVWFAPDPLPPAPRR